MNLFEQIRNKFPLSNDKWNEYINYFQRIDVPARTILLKEGQVSNKLFVIEKGCIRAWFNNNGADVTFQFFFENETVASIESFRKRIPSLVSLEAIEPGVLWCIHKKDVDMILDEVKQVPAIQDIFMNVIFERTFDYMKHFLSFIKDTPQQRYLDLLNKKPQIIKRVPQRYIASYLGISSVHLSRIKSQLAKMDG